MFPEFAAERLGYRYVWQTDDDSGFVAPLDFDMVKMMQQRGLSMAAASTMHDTVDVTAGLPELTAYFLQVRNANVIPCRLTKFQNIEDAVGLPELAA